MAYDIVPITPSPATSPTQYLVVSTPLSAASWQSLPDGAKIAVATPTLQNVGGQQLWVFDLSGIGINAPDLWGFDYKYGVAIPAFSTPQPQQMLVAFHEERILVGGQAAFCRMVHNYLTAPAGAPTQTTFPTALNHGDTLGVSSYTPNIDNTPGSAATVTGVTAGGGSFVTADLSALSGALITYSHSAGVLYYTPGVGPFPTAPTGCYIQKTGGIQANYYLDHIAAPTAAPTGLSGSGVCEGPQATLSWGTVTGATGYRLYRDGTLIYDGASTGFIDAMAVALGTTYHYAVSAYNAGGEGPQSASIAITPCAASSVPGTPTGLSGPGVCEGPQATLTWNPVPGATGYVLTRDGVDIYTGAATTFVDSPLTLGQSHVYRVLATNAIGDSAPSAAVTITPCSAASCCAWSPTEQATAAPWTRIETPCSH